jgi:hypothetical protein
MSRGRLAAAAAGAVLGGGSFSLCDASDAIVGAMQLPPLQQPAAAGGSGPSRTTAKEAAAGHLKIGVTMREVSEGTGEVALPGMVAIVHYTVTLVGDGTVLDDTRNSGVGDRRCASSPICRLTCACSWVLSRAIAISRSSSSAHNISGSAVILRTAIQNNTPSHRRYPSSSDTASRSASSLGPLTTRPC